MILLDIPAMSGVFFNDVLAILSVVGCGLLFLSALFQPSLQKLEQLGEWGTAPLVFGTFFQVSLLIVDIRPGKIGFVVPMTPAMVNGLFAASLLLFGGWWRLTRKPR